MTTTISKARVERIEYISGKCNVVLGGVSLELDPGQAKKHGRELRSGLVPLSYVWVVMDGEGRVYVTLDEPKERPND